MWSYEYIQAPGHDSDSCRLKTEVQAQFSLNKHHDMQQQALYDAPCGSDPLHSILPADL
jgi:hypothetical protein